MTPISYSSFDGGNTVLVSVPRSCACGPTTASVEIETARIDAEVVVPSSALLRRGGQEVAVGRRPRELRRERRGDDPRQEEHQADVAPLRRPSHLRLPAETRRR